MGDAYQWGNLATQAWGQAGQQWQGVGNSWFQNLKMYSDMLQNYLNMDLQSAEAAKGREHDIALQGMRGEQGIKEIMTQLEGQGEAADTQRDFLRQQAGEERDITASQRREDISQRNIERYADDYKESEKDRIGGLQAILDMDREDATWKERTEIEHQNRLSEREAGQAEETSEETPADIFIHVTMPDLIANYGYNMNDPAQREAIIPLFEAWYIQKYKRDPTPEEINYVRTNFGIAIPTGKPTDKTATKKTGKSFLQVLYDILGPGFIDPKKANPPSTNTSTWTESQRYY